MSENTTRPSRTLADRLAEPFDPSVVRMKPAFRGGQPLPYISHGLCTKRLNAECPDWSSRLLGREIVTLPVPVKDFKTKQITGYQDHTWVEVTLELSIPGLGSCQEVGVAEMLNDYGTASKAAVSDALKRAAMRFGIALSLWESMDEADEDAHPEPVLTPRQTPQDAPEPLTEAQERVIAQAYDLAQAGEQYPAVIALLKTLHVAATPDQWIAIKRALAAIKSKHYAEKEAQA